MEVEKNTSLKVGNGTVDIHGAQADKTRTGGWKASIFIIMNEVAERLAFYALAVNMVSYLVVVMHQPLPDAVTHVTDWIGAAFVLTIVGAFLADAYLGRFLTIIVFSCIYAMGMILLTVSASLDGLHPKPCVGKLCMPAESNQTIILYIALSLIALGTGGIKPCVSSFGADQYDETDPKEAPKKHAFFNWFFFAINTGALLGITVMVYIQVKVGWGWGFGVPTGVMVVSLVVVVAGVRLYRFQKPTGSAFTRFAQVVVAACRNHFRGVGREGDVALYEVGTQLSHIAPGVRKLEHTKQYRFLDKAAMTAGRGDGGGECRSRWRLCTVTQVEEFKCFVRVVPVWVTIIPLYVSFAQLSTFFVSQAGVMDRSIGPHFLIPQGSIPVFTSINAVILVPLYEGIVVPILRRYTGHRRGITSLQRMGVGLFISIFALISAAIIENHRRNSSNPRSLTVFWLFPQFFLMGSAEVFTYVGQLEFFYDEATDGTRSLSSAMFLSEVGIGSWLSSAIVRVVVVASGGKDEGWLRNDLDKSRLDWFYWVLVGLNVVNFLVYVAVARGYRGRRGVGRSVRDDVLIA